MKLLSLLKYNIKQNYLVFIIICGVMILYLATIINMYDPNGLEELIALANYKMPPEIMGAFGFTIENNASLLHLINSFFYGMLLYFTLIIYVIIVGDRLIAEHVNNGTMAYLLSTPNTRCNIACMQAGFFLITIAMKRIIKADNSNRIITIILIESELNLVFPDEFWVLCTISVCCGVGCGV